MLKKLLCRELLSSIFSKAEEIKKLEPFSFEDLCFEIQKQKIWRSVRF